MDKVWADEGSRAMEVLGGEQPRFKRTVNDMLIIQFKLADWNKIFNVAADYQPSSEDWTPYDPNKDLAIYFIRRKVEEHK